MYLKDVIFARIIQDITAFASSLSDATILWLYATLSTYN